MNLTDWTPKSVLALKNYRRQNLVHDLIAGATVGMVALPLAMAFAIASGMPPQSGIYTAIVAGFLISALGGSRLQIGGPTGAFVVIIYGIVTQYGVDGLFVCTVMAGVILILMGASGLGSAVKFIPRPVVIGFTNGIAILIASTQIKDFFGLKTGKVPGDFVGRFKVLAHSAGTISPETTALSCLSLLIIILTVRFWPRIPGYIVAMVAGTLLVVLFRLPVETIGTRFGGIPPGFPRFHAPVITYQLLRSLASPAITIAMLGAIESLMSAVVADRMSGDTHNPNVELIGQGIANIFSPMFGGLPATGAIARTATNIRSGGKTPLAGIVHAVTLLIIVLIAAPLAKFIPLSALAAILLVVCYNMGEWHEIPQLLKLSRLEIGTWIVTLSLTVFVNLTVAVEAGMILAALIFIRKVTSTTTVTRVTDEYLEEGSDHTLPDKEIPSYVAIFRIHGPFLFGSAEKITDVSKNLAELPEIVILRLRNMTVIDSTGLQTLQRFADEVHASGRTLILCGAREQPTRLMRQAEFEQHVGAENICPHVRAALERASMVYSELQMAEGHGISTPV
ncbi:MAG: SulP family inorganic anion transporter [Acidobacteriaceae bacterium]